MFVYACVTAIGQRSGLPSKMHVCLWSQLLVEALSSRRAKMLRHVLLVFLHRPIQGV